MQKAIIWFWLNVKSSCKNRILYFIYFAVMVICWIIGSVQTDNDDLVGVCIKGRYNYDVLASKIVDSDKYVIYSEETSLTDDIVRGTCDCGFVIAENYDEIITNGSKTRSVKVISRTGYLYSEIDKEYIVSAMLYALSDKIIDNETVNVFDISDDQIVTWIKERKNEYLKGDILFDADINYVDYTGNINNAILRFDKHYCLLCIIFVVILCLGTDRFGGNVPQIVKAIGKGDSFLFLLVHFLPESIGVGLAGIAGYALGNSFFSAINIIEVMLTALATMVWVTVLGEIVKKETIYNALCSAIIMATFIIYPVFGDITFLYAPIGYLRYFLPIIHFC